MVFRSISVHQHTVMPVKNTIFSEVKFVLSFLCQHICVEMHLQLTHSLLIIMNTFQKYAVKKLNGRMLVK